MSWKVVKSIPKSAKKIELPGDWVEAMIWLEERGLVFNGVIHEVWETKRCYYVVATPAGSTSAFIYRVRKQ